MVINKTVLISKINFNFLIFQHHIIQIVTGFDYF